MTTRSRKALGVALLAALVALVVAAGTPAHAWVTCPDGSMANHGACPGPQGPAGPRGASGGSGPAGPRGVQGETGPQGVQGETGPQGVQGETGPQGVQGETGPQGVQGETGPRGPRGFTGHVKPDWAAMTLASGAIPFLEKPLSFGVGAGTVGEVGAVAFGVQVQISERLRLNATVMTSGHETGAAAGAGFSF